MWINPISKALSAIDLSSSEQKRNIKLYMIISTICLVYMIVSAGEAT
jgi:hypothetical protein